VKTLQKLKNSLNDSIYYADASRIVNKALNLYYKIASIKLTGGYLAFGDLTNGLFGCIRINEVEKKHQRMMSSVASSAFNNLLQKVDKDEDLIEKPFYSCCKSAVQMGEVGAHFASEMSAECNMAVAIYYLAHCQAMSQNQSFYTQAEKIKEKIHEHIAGFLKTTNIKNDFLLKLEEALK
jgi:hypothetical protein